MRILVIEDDDNKFNKIYNTLNNILNHCEIIRTKSRNSGLSTFFESIKLNEKFDLIICDNFLPFFDDEIDLLPYMLNIIWQRRRLWLWLLYSLLPFNGFR